MGKFYEKVWKHYHSNSPISRAQGVRRINNKHADDYVKKKITIGREDQSIAFWDLEEYFGEGDSILNITESQKEQYIREFGSQALTQGYLRAKVRIFCPNLLSIDDKKIWKQKNK